MRGREGSSSRQRWAIPAKIKKQGDPYIYKGTLEQYFDRFEFHYRNGATTLTFKEVLIEQVGCRTYMKFEREYDQHYVVFFETRDLLFAVSDKY